MKNYNKNKGFTLIELMISVAVVAILAVIAVPAYMKYTVKAQISEGLVMSDGVKTKVIEYYNENGVMPTSNADIDWDSSSGGKYVSNINVGENGKINVTFGLKANKVIQSKQVPGDTTITKNKPVYYSGTNGYGDMSAAIQASERNNLLNLARNTDGSLVPKFHIIESSCYTVNPTGYSYIVCGYYRQKSLNGPYTLAGNYSAGYRTTSGLSCAAGEMISGGKCVPNPNAKMASSTGVLDLTPTPDPTTNTVKWGCTMTIDMAYIPSGCTFRMSGIL